MKFRQMIRSDEDRHSDITNFSNKFYVLPVLFLLGLTISIVFVSSEGIKSNASNGTNGIYVFHHSLIVNNNFYNRGDKIMRFIDFIKEAVLPAIAIFVVMLIFVSFLDFECGKTMAGTYKLSNGSTVTCGSAYKNHCGLSLYNCNDGQTYICQQNVTKLGGK